MELKKEPKFQEWIFKIYSCLSGPAIEPSEDGLLALVLSSVQVIQHGREQPSCARKLLCQMSHMGWGNGKHQGIQDLIVRWVIWINQWWHSIMMWYKLNFHCKLLYHFFQNNKL